jgi:hypothetical protein
MKTSQFIFVCLSVFVLGSALGYCVGWKRGLHKGYVLTVNSYLESTQLNLEHETRAYLMCLQAIDSGNAAEMSNLVQVASERLRLYDFETQLDRSNGYDWDDDQFYTNVTAYLKGHPKR